MAEAPWQLPEPAAPGGAVLLTPEQLSLLHGLLDRPDGIATSVADLARAAVPYIKVYRSSISLRRLERAARSLHPAWVDRHRLGRRTCWQLTARGRAIIDLRVAAIVVGRPRVYEGIAALRQHAGHAAAQARIDALWAELCRRPEHALLTAAADALVDAWCRLHPCEPGKVASLRRHWERDRIRTWVRSWALRKHELPTGRRRIAKTIEVDFDELRWPA